MPAFWLAHVPCPVRCARCGPCALGLQLLDGAIEALDLSFKQLGAPHCTLLGEALPESPALRLVDLRSNGLGDDGSNAFAVMLPRSCDAHPRHAPAPSSAMPALISPPPAPCHELILACSVPPGSGSARRRLLGQLRGGAGSALQRHRPRGGQPARQGPCHRPGRRAAEARPARQPGGETVGRSSPHPAAQRSLPSPSACVHHMYWGYAARTAGIREVGR
eukprot:COSAG01_NODE_1057_length_11899_cov_5.159492_5_plen_220_part_00